MQTLSAGDIIYYVGDEPNGLHLIISGLIHVHYKPDEDNGRDEIEKGVVPNTEMFSDTMFATELDEYFGRGFLLGEMGVLVGNPRASAVQCETDVTLYHWPRLTVRDGIGNFGGEFDSLESRLWRSYGIKYATEFLRNQSKYAVRSIKKCFLTVTCRLTKTSGFISPGVLKRFDHIWSKELFQSAPLQGSLMFLRRSQNAFSFMASVNPTSPGKCILLQGACQRLPKMCMSR